jgi:hypothetical protein
MISRQGNLEINLCVSPNGCCGDGEVSAMLVMTANGAEMRTWFVSAQV